MIKKKHVYAFIDAANLFYGGEKSLGWKIDYQKLLHYLKQKYCASKIFYYAGVEMHDFPYSVLQDKQIQLRKLYLHLQKKIQEKRLSKEEVILIGNHIKKVKFYLKLEGFGYKLRLKPTKIYRNEGRPVKKANCDVDMTLDLVRYMEQYQETVVLSGDGDFAIVLKYLQSKGRKIYILSRGERSAKEIRQLAGKDFRDFNYLRELLKFQI